MRHHDWPEKLLQFVESARSMKFEYGTHDCVQFSAKAVEAMIGENLAADWHYANKVGAYKLISKAGGLVPLVSEVLGEPIPVAQAGRGDVVVADLECGQTVGICLGQYCAFAAEPVGVTLRPRILAHTAWKVS